MPDNDFDGVKLCVVGDQGAGKSHFLATLYMHLQRISHLDNLIGRVHATEKFGGGVGITANFNRLQLGQPTISMETGKTSQTTMTIPVYNEGIRGFLYRTGLGWIGLSGSRDVNIHILDSSGEYQSFLMEQADFPVDEQYRSTDSPTAHVNIVFDSKDQSRLEMLIASQPDVDEASVTEQFKGLLGDYDAYILLYNLEDYFRKDQNRIDSVDLKLMRFLDNVKQYRHKTNIRQPKHIAIVFTHYDTIADEEFIKFGVPKYNSSDAVDYGRLLSQQAYYAIDVLTRTEGGPPVFVSYTEMEPSGTKFVREIDHGSFVTKYPFDTYTEIVDWIKGLG